MMNNTTRIQSYSQVFGSDIKNHDYVRENNLAKSGNATTVSASYKQSEPNKSVYNSSRISLAPLTREQEARKSQRHSQKQKTNWQDLIPPMPEDDDLGAGTVSGPVVGAIPGTMPGPVASQGATSIYAANGSGMTVSTSNSDFRKSKAPPSLHELKTLGLAPPSSYSDPRYTSTSNNGIPQLPQQMAPALLQSPQFGGPTASRPMSQIQSQKSQQLQMQQQQSLQLQQQLQMQQQLQLSQQQQQQQLQLQVLPQQQMKQQPKVRRHCNGCGEPLTGQFLRALNAYYHLDCLRCVDCNQPCADKYFASEQVINGQKIAVAVCEYDYFKKFDLICYGCDKALRGSHVTGLGHKYHLNHFVCDICHISYEEESNFHEHNGKPYCRKHYAKHFAKRCEGCKTPIISTYVQTFRGGKNQPWHHHCLACYQFWNVTIPIDSINPSQEEIDSCNIDLSMISKICFSLSGFEEAAASCISSMIQFATSDYLECLNAAARLVIKIEALFKAFDALYLLNVEQVIKDAEQKVLQSQGAMDVDEDEMDKKNESRSVKYRYEELSKEPRNLSAKLMNFIVFLKQSATNAITVDAKSKKKVLSTATHLAHYLKLIVRYGLHNALEYNRVVGNQVATDRFLNEINKHKLVSANDDPFDLISKLIPISSNDECFVCSGSIEESCIKFNKLNNVRWHFDCLVCAGCGCQIDEHIVKDTTFSTKSSCLFCPSCTIKSHDNTCEKGLEYVSKLMQIIYINQIGLVRVKYCIVKAQKDKGMLKNSSTRAVGTTSSNTAAGSNENRNSVEKRKADQNYVQTVTDIKRFKSARHEKQQQSRSALGSFRKSIILSMPAPKTAGMANAEDEFDEKPSLSLSKNQIEVREEGNTGDLSQDIVNNLKQEEQLTLDDIHRIVATNEAKDLLPNAFKHNKNATIPKKFFHNDIGTQKIKSNGDEGKGSELAAGGNGEPKVKGKYFSELSNEEHFIIRHIAIIALFGIVNKNFSLEQLLDLIPTRKQQTFWSKIKGNKKSAYKGPKVFGAPLEELTEKYGVETTRSMGPSPLRIPAFIDDCLSALYQKDLAVEGIFRKNGNIRKLRELTEKINENPDKMPDFNNETQIQLSALMKKFFREMPDSLFTFKLYDIWIESQKYDDSNVRKRILKLIFVMLPKCNRDLLEILLFFLNFVASFAYMDEENGSKMDSHNLATVLAPNILYQKPTNDATQKGGPTSASVLQANTEAGDGYLLSIEVVGLLIDSQEEFRMVPEDVMNFYNKLIQEDPSISVSNDNKNQLTSKELLGKISSFLEKNPTILKRKDDASDNITMMKVTESSVPGTVPMVVKGSPNFDGAAADVVEE